MNTAAPVRLQLSRKAGFDLQQLSRDTNGLPAVSVARPHIYGNPYTAKRLHLHLAAGFSTKNASRAVADNSWIMLLAAEYAENAVLKELFRAWCRAFEEREPENFAKWIAPLRGKNVACACGLDEACHADVLLEIANR